MGCERKCEDDKVKKTVTHLLKSIKALFGSDSYDGVKYEDMLAYIEGKKCSEWTQEDERICSNITDHLREYYVEKKDYPYIADENSPETEERNWLSGIKSRIKKKS